MPKKSVRIHNLKFQRTKCSAKCNVMEFELLEKIVRNIFKLLDWNEKRGTTKWYNANHMAFEVWAGALEPFRPANITEMLTAVVSCLWFGDSYIQAAIKMV